MTDPIPARLAALKTMALPDLKTQWRDLFESEPPPFNRRFLESRLAYRIQELAYGGLKPETVKRLEVLGEQFSDRNVTRRRTGHNAMPIAGTQTVIAPIAPTAPESYFETKSVEKGFVMLNIYMGFDAV